MRLTGLLGILFILGCCYLFSTNRKAIRLKTVLWGIGLQFLFAILVTRYTYGQRFMEAAGNAVNHLLAYAQNGAQFVFGSLASPTGNVGFVFAFYVLPTIVFIAAFFAVMYYFGVMQFIIKWAAIGMTRLMGVSGAESLDVAASIFMGQTEAPLTIRPFIPSMTRSELMTIMTAGMAHVSGGIMAAYIAYGVEAKHILAAVIMTAPGTILIAKMLVPETETPVSGSRVEMSSIERDSNILSAIARGTLDGLRLAVNVGAMLIAFIALIALVNGILGGLHNWLGWSWLPASMEQFFGWIFRPLAWLIGIPWADSKIVGSLLGVRMVINELVAFSQLGPLRDQIAQRSFTIATFALCGFANFSSIGIQIGGIGALAENKKEELAKLGFRAMLGGTAANLLSASIVGLLIQ